MQQVGIKYHILMYWFVHNMHGHDRHNTTILSIIRNMSTTWFDQYYFWPLSGWIQLSEKTTQYVI